mgnify:CR=1 FL=1
MMLTKRIQNIKPAATLALTGKVAELRKQGIDVIAFNLGEPDFGTPQNICDAAKAAIDAQKTKYTVVSGIMDLKEAICAKFLKDNNVVYKPNEICVGTGAKQPLVNAVLALCEEGDEVIIPTPCWVSYIEMVKLSGATPVLVQNREEDGFALNVEGIKKAITPKTKAIMINTPNNPTGAVYTEESIRMVTDILKKKQEEYGHPIYLVSDEPYRKLAYDIEVPYLTHYYENTIVVYSYSKALSIPGERIGYIAMETCVQDYEDLIAGMTASMRYLGYVNAPSLQQKMLLKCVDASVDISIYQETRDILYNALTEIGYTCIHPDGAFYLFVKALEEDDTKFCERAKEEKILMAPGTAFYGPGWVRVSYCVPAEVAKRSIPAFQRLYDKYQAEQVL